MIHLLTGQPLATHNLLETNKQKLHQGTGKVTAFMKFSIHTGSWFSYFAGYACYQQTTIFCLHTGHCHQHSQLYCLGLFAHRLPERNSRTNPRAHPAVLSPVQESQEPVLAMGSYAAGQAMGFPGTAWKQFTSSSPQTSSSEVFSHWNAEEEAGYAFP